jgi:cyclopropane fatty-acyl-phospholipid synthase-like methyltransferase
MTATPSYKAIVDHYEACLAQHGDSHRGVDWPNAEDADMRYRVMLEVIRDRPYGRPTRLLDFGCGASHLYEYLRREQVEGVEYSGIDLSEPFIDLSRTKFPEIRYWCLDILTSQWRELPRFDYVVINGVFTEKLELGFDEMFVFMQRVVKRLFGLVDHGLAFNAMSKHVDWERPDLFHLPFDRLAQWLTAEVSRNIVLRSDYGLHEYTTYVYRESSR